MRHCSALPAPTLVLPSNQLALEMLWHAQLDSCLQQAAGSSWALLMEPTSTAGTLQHLCSKRSAPAGKPSVPGKKAPPAGLLPGLGKVFAGKVFAGRLLYQESAVRSAADYTNGPPTKGGCRQLAWEGTALYARSADSVLGHPWSCCPACLPVEGADTEAPPFQPGPGSVLLLR